MDNDSEHPIKLDRLLCHQCQKVFLGDIGDCDVVWFQWYDTTDCAPVCPTCADALEGRKDV